MPRRFLAIATTLATVAGGALLAPAATADIQHPSVVSEDPIDDTPHVGDGTVHAFARVGNKVVVAGDFTTVRNHGTSAYIERTNIFAFDLTTKRVDTAFVPEVDGTVYALAPGEDGTVYAGGHFRTVNGDSQAGITRLNVADGSQVPSFADTRVPNGTRVLRVVRRGDNLYIAGTFGKVNGTPRSTLARLDSDTGEVDPSFDIDVAESREGALKIQMMDVTRDDTRLVIGGTFTEVNGKDRYQIAMIDTASSPAETTSWSTDRYGPVCSSNFNTYLRDIDFSPDGDYFAVVTTGGARGDTTLCDSAARWETDETGGGQEPTWANWTGGDTLLSVSVTDAAVYVGGHQRWMDNPDGKDDAGPGAVPREGIAAIHPTEGDALSWNPGRTRGVGVRDLVAWPGGLLVGSDTSKLGGEWHERVGAFPVS